MAVRLYYIFQFIMFIIILHPYDVFDCIITLLSKLWVYVQFYNLKTLINHLKI